MRTCSNMCGASLLQMAVHLRVETRHAALATHARSTSSSSHGPWAWGPSTYDSLLRMCCLRPQCQNDRPELARSPFPPDTARDTPGRMRPGPPARRRAMHLPSSGCCLSFYNVNRAGVIRWTTCVRDSLHWLPRARRARPGGKRPPPVRWRRVASPSRQAFVVGFIRKLASST